MESGTLSRLDFLLVIGGGLLFGLLYNIFVARLESSGRDRPYTSLLVGFGVLVTLTLSAVLIGVNNALLALFTFFFTGLPMIVGHAYRYSEEMRNQNKQSREIINQLLEQASQRDDILDSIKAIQRSIQEAERDKSKGLAE